MKPTDVLMQEHRVIELVLSCLDRMADNCDAGHSLDVEAARQALDFFRVFADQCHHGKEEDLLFPFMEAKGFSREQGPTGVMLHEHELGRRHVRGMADALNEFSLGDLSGKLVFVEHARAFSALLRQHIQKEDHCLFRMADQALSDLEQDELSKSFNAVENEQLGRETHERYLKVAFALADRLGIPAGNCTASSHCGCSGTAQPAANATVCSATEPI
jgi:hemerythrin-like domain-containing protein